MKRRLSVAISLIGGPPVVYLDEPSTGLDPAARRQLWGMVQRTKRDKAIVLTTHSMEEAEGLCDRIGIFIDGRLVCIGNPRELTNRFIGHYVRAPRRALRVIPAPLHRESVPTGRLPQATAAPARRGLRSGPLMPRPLHAARRPRSWRREQACEHLGSGEGRLSTRARRE